ncbi:MAG: putative Ig domain-containing protein, partial [Candidatus Aminicenantes bacterium]|nr:putative Ig domain-containing protein [Candidatus Aminicenantes bacterium]
MPGFTEDVGDQIWAENQEIEPLVLPTAEGGNGELEYSLEGALPEGLEYDEATRTVSGTPAVSPAPTEFTWTASDVDGDSDEVRFYVFGSAAEDLVPDFAERIPDQVYVDGWPIEPLSLPVATGGTGELEYSLEGVLPEGLEYDAVTRTISGIPVGAHAPGEYTWTATDANGDAENLIFSLVVEEDVNPEFTGEVQNQTWIQNSEIAVLRFPGAEGGNAPYVYSVSPELPAGLSFWAGDQTISGTPTEFQERTIYTYRAVDADEDPVELTFSLEVIEDLTPSFAGGVGGQIWTEDSEVEPLVLPEGSGGNGDLTYELSPELAQGLVFDPETRTISGTPVVPKERTRHVYRVLDVDGDAAVLTFSVEVLKDLMPSFPEAVQNQTWIQDSEIAALDLPGAEGGNGAISYSITPELPAGLTFRLGDQTILGTPTEAQERTLYVYRAVDADGDPVEMTFSLEVLEDLMPSFPESVEAQIWTQDSPLVEPLQLPAAEGGNGALFYSLSPELPEEMSFDARTLLISGRPTDPLDETDYTLTATDGDGDPVDLVFSVTVLEDLMPSFPAVVRNQLWTQDSEIEPIQVPEAEGGNRELASMRYTLIPELPAGVTFDAGSLTISGTPENPQDLTRYVIRARDADGDVAGFAFSVRVLEDLMPSFPETVEDQIWTQDSPIGTLALPVGEGGNGVDQVEGLLSYALSPDLPDGLMFEGTRQRIRGTPAVPMDETTFTYTATDNDGDSVELTFSLTVLEDLMPSFPAEVRNQLWTQDSEIEPIQLPAAEGGNRELASMRYTLTPELPAGVTLDEGSLTISGTPENPQDLTRYVFRARDADGDVVGLAFTVKVLEDLMPSFGESVEDHIWTQDSPIGTLELPVAEGGNGVDGVEGLLSYTLSPDLPDGLMFEGTRQRIRGTPAVPMDETTFTYTATDDDGDSVELTFSLTVLEDLMPSFSAEVRNQLWTQDSEIEPIQVPEAEGGNRELASIRYTLTPELPAGVTFDDESLTISGTPEDPQDLTRYVLRAIDADGDVVGLAFMVKVLEDRMPSFDESVEDQIWTQDSPIGTLELPVAKDGNGVDGVEGLLSYTLSPDLPEGLVFEGTRQRIRGTPAVPMDETTFTYTATDNDGDSVELTFSLTVLEDLMPSFSAEVRNQAWTQDSEIEPIELPQASGGNVELTGELTYTLTPELPAGVTLNGATISGTPTVDQELTRYVYRAIDADGDVAGVAFWVVVAEDLTPEFTEGVEDRDYLTDLAIAAWVLPEATSGNGLLVYTLTPDLPEGLSFDPPSRKITGTPTVAQDRMEYTYTATDADGDTGSLTFGLTITLAKPTARNLLPDLQLLAGGNTASVNVDGLFTGQKLEYQFESNDTDVATVQSDGASAVVTPKHEGSAMVTVTATNPSGSVAIEFSVAVSTAPEERAVLDNVLAGLARARLSSLTGVIGRRFEAGAASSMSASQASRYEASRRDLWFDDLDASLGGSGGPGDSHRKPTSRLWGRTFAVALGSGESGMGGEWAGAGSVQSMSESSFKVRWSLWGAGDQQSFSGGESNQYEGDLRSVYVGLDGEFGKPWLGGSRWLSGVSIASSSGEAEYDFTESDMSGSGTLTTSLTSVYPYMRGVLASGLELWSIAGAGSGEVTNERAHLDGTTDEGDLTMGLLALGMRKPLTAAQTRLTLLGDAAQEWLSANGAGSLAYSPVSSVQRARMGVEVARRMGGLEPFGEVSGRYDGGDGDAGSGVEVAAGSRYRSARLDVEARGRMLAMHSASGYKETGFGARIRVRSHADGTGMSMSLSPRWGRAEGNGTLWRDQALQLRSGGAVASGLRAPALGGEIGYGFAAAQGVLTPTLQMHRSDYGSTRLGLALG